MHKTMGKWCLPCKFRSTLLRTIFYFEQIVSVMRQFDTRHKNKALRMSAIWLYCVDSKKHNNFKRILSWALRVDGVFEYIFLHLSCEYFRPLPSSRFIGHHVNLTSMVVFSPFVIAFHSHAFFPMSRPFSLMPRPFSPLSRPFSPIPRPFSPIPRLDVCPTSKPSLFRAVTIYWTQSGRFVGIYPG